MNIQPSQSMRPINAAIYLDLAIAVIVKRSRLFADKFFVRRVRHPCEIAGQWVIAHQLAELLLSNLRNFHKAPFISGLGITDMHQPDGNESSFRPLRLGWCSANFTSKVNK